MSFEKPLAWTLLALALPIVLLHLHLVRRRRVEVSSLDLWRELLPEGAGRGGLRRLRDRAALAFLLAALVAFAASAAGPVTGAAASAPRRLAIVVDASATMNARSGSGTRFDEALVALGGVARRLAAHDELTVWLATATPTVAVEPTHDASRAADLFLAAGVTGLGPNPIAATLLPAGIAKTTRLAALVAAGVERREATVLVLTDAVGAAALADLPASGVGVRVGVAGAGAVRNAGITAFDLDPADASRLVVGVTTTDGPGTSREVVLQRGDEELARVPVDLATEDRASVKVPLGALAKAGGVIEARLEPADDFTADDAAALVLPSVRPLAVAVVSARPSPFLVEALRAMPDVADPARTTLVAPGAPASAFDGVDVVIADGVAAPAGRPSLTFLAEGARFADRPLLWGVGAHPVLAGADLAPLRIERAAVLDPAPGETAIVATSAGAVGVAGGEGAQRHVVLGLRPEASTLPLEAAFPLLVRNAVRWLGTPPAAPRYVVAGEPWPGGDGEVVPYPRPGERLLARSRQGVESVVRWVPARGFRLSPERPVAAMSAAEAVASLPDRHLDEDTRRRWGPECAAAGAVALLAGALLLSSARRRFPEAPTGGVPALAGVRSAVAASR